jgi:hypothetical protein
MKNSATKTNLMAVALVAGLLLLPQTAAADGGASILLVPEGESAEVIRHGLDLYRMGRRIRNEVRARQKGRGNGFAVEQHGEDNIAGVLQRGDGHQTSVVQNGNRNAFGVIQLGRGTSSSHVQHGEDQLGLSIEAGW